MAKAIFATGAAPDTPAAGTLVIYALSSTKAIYSKNEDGTVVALGSGGGGGSPAGSNKYVQFNDAGVFGGHAGFQYDQATGIVTIAGDAQLGRACIEDTDASHYLCIVAGSNLTSDRTLTVTTGDASRTVTLSANLTVTATADVSGTLVAASGKTFTCSNTLTFSGTDSSSVAFGAGGTVTYTSNNLSVFAATTSAQLAGVISDETGTGALVFANTPTLVTPILGTPTSGTLTNCTGLPISTGVSGLGAGVATFLATPSSANLISAVTDETGTGSLVFSASPALTGTPTAPTAAAGTSTTQVATTAFVTGAIREKLTAARTYYVRTDGSDSNTGLVDSAGGAFLTIQKAYDVITGTLDLAGYTVTVQIRDGTYTGGLAATAAWTGGGAITFQGNSGTPANVIISTTSASAFSFSGFAMPGTVTIKDMKLQTTTSGSGILHNSPGLINFTNIVFGAIADAGLRANAAFAKIICTGNYSITAAATYHMWALAGGVIVVEAVTVTITGTPAFSVFANAQFLGLIVGDGNTYSGSATGQRYNGGYNAVIYVGGGGANYFPGDSAGATSTGAQYG